MAMVDMTESVQPIDAVQLNGVWYKLADATEADQFQVAWENPVRVAPADAGHIDSAKFCTLQGVSEKALTPSSYDFNPSDAAFIAKVKDIVGETIPCDTSAAAGIQAALERVKDDVPAALDPLLHSKNPIKRAAAEFRRDVLPPVPEIPDPLEDKTVFAALRTGVESQRESRSPVGTLKKAENQCNCGHCLYCLFHFFGLTPHSSTIADLIRSVKDVVSPAPTTPSSASDLRDIVSRIKAKNVGLRLLGFGAPLDTADEMKQILFSYPTLLAFVKRVDSILTGTVQLEGCRCGACWHCLMAQEQHKRKQEANQNRATAQAIVDELKNQPTEELKGFERFLKAIHIHRETIPVIPLNDPADHRIYYAQRGAALGFETQNPLGLFGSPNYEGVKVDGKWFAPAAEDVAARLEKAHPMVSTL